MYKKTISVLLSVLCFAFVLTGCAAPSQTTASSAASSAAEPTPVPTPEATPQAVADRVTVTDALSRTVEIQNPQRVAVLSGSFAEAWVLAGGTLTAVTDDAEELMTLSADTAVVGTVKNPDLERLVETGADLVILSAAITAQVELQDALEQLGLTVLYCQVETFADYKAMMQMFTQITGRADLYQQNVLDIENAITEQIGRADGSAPTVLFLRAYSSGVRAKGSDSMTGGMLQDLGCTNIADGNDTLLEDLSMEAIIAADPDYIFVTTMGSSEADALEQVETLLISNPAWNGLSAVKNQQYHVLPQALFHNKPNARWAESYQILADILYGE